MVEQLRRIFTLEVGQPERVKIVLAGCGGTGSFAALHLAQLAAVSRLSVDLLFVDPDTVEASNIGRQNFCPAEIGQPKAVTLARRFSFAYGLDIEPVVSPFEVQLVARGVDLTLVVGCVDNAAARRDIQRAMVERGERGGLWWLDAGNDHSHGQVAIGNSLNPRPLASSLGVVWALPLPGVQEPGLLVEAPEVSPESCAELAQREAQSRTINKMMATWIDLYCERLLVSRDLSIMRTVIDQRSGRTYSEPITEPEIVRDVTPAPEGYYEVGTPVCPDCGAEMIAGFDEVRGETVDIFRCTVCDYRVDQEAYAEQGEYERAMEAFYA